MKKTITNILIISILISLFACKKEVVYVPLSQEIKDYAVFNEGTYWIYRNDSTLELDTFTVANLIKIEMKGGYERKSIIQPYKWEHTKLLEGYTTNIEHDEFIFYLFIKSYDDRDNDKDNIINTHIFLKEKYRFFVQNGSSFTKENLYLLFNWRNDSLLLSYNSNNEINTFKITQYPTKITTPWLESAVPVYTIEDFSETYTLEGITYKDVYHIKALMLICVSDEERNYDNPDYYFTCDYWVAKNNWIIKKIIRYWDLEQSWTLVESKIIQN